MREYWKRVRYRLEWFGCMILAKGIPMLPRRVCVVLANVLGFITFYLDSRGRKVALANLEMAFGETYSASERSNIARRSYQNFARAMIDVFWASRLTPENYTKYFKIEGAEHIAGFLEEGKGVVSVGVHYGSFEWASIGSAFAGLKSCAVAETFKNPLLGNIFLRNRKISGHEVIPQENAAIRLFKLVKKGGRVGFLADLTQKPSKATAAVKVFGRKMCVTMLHAMLAERGNVPILKFQPVPLPDGTCRLIFHPPVYYSGKTASEIAQSCWDDFEAMIRRDPHLWLWAYKHWRYKPRDAAETYPFYANVSSKFDKIFTNFSHKPNQ